MQAYFGPLNLAEWATGGLNYLRGDELDDVDSLEMEMPGDHLSLLAFICHGLIRA